jgi:4-hydroxybenzoate polyprenyltransferase
MNVAAREGQTYGGGSLASRYASLVKLPHTLFALPFAGVGALLASYTFLENVTVSAVLWIVVAFTAARFAAMGFNRIVDRKYDALNPRTMMRELPAGTLTMTQAVAAVIVASGLFIFASWQLNPLCGVLSPVALAWVFFYSYTKRFTSLAHSVLGLALGIAPVGAYLAISGTWVQPWYGLVILAASVMCWVSGFDIVYALQDVDFDRQHKLHSIPARFGMRRSLIIARALHIGAVAGFLAIAVFQLFPVRWLYAVAVGLMAGLLMYEHVLVSKLNASKLDLRTVDRAFFKLNVLVSTSFFALTLLDRLMLA